MAQPFAEFIGNRRLMWIAEEWQRYADRLADWAMERLVNRRDVWSQYTLKNGEVGVVMLPIKERRHLGSDMVTLDKLRRHFAGRAVSHLIGLHSISDHNTCRWFAIDVDLHDESIANADEIAQANFAACLEWANRLRAMKMDPLIMDSNGVGGYHVWVLLDREYPLADVFEFVDNIRSDYQKFGLPRKPEVFPPKAMVKEGHLPYGLRLPGRHHTRPHYTRIWNFDGIGENEWLEGGDAIEAMLNTIPAPLPRKAKSKKRAVAASANGHVAKKSSPPAKKPRVCVDLDGVLAEYDGWHGLDRIGQPLPGALEFAKSLAEIADIVVFTSRCSEDVGNDVMNTRLSPGRMRIKVIEWLEHHKFPFADVYVGRGKPRVAAFIDDRAVNCSPQKDKNAFKLALADTKLLLTKKNGNGRSGSSKTKQEAENLSLRP